MLSWVYAGLAKIDLEMTGSNMPAMGLFDRLLAPSYEYPPRSNFDNGESPCRAPVLRGACKGRRTEAL